MRTFLKNASNRALYPWLLALIPIVFLYSNNFYKVFSDEFVVACVLITLVVSLIVGLAWLAFRDVDKAAAVVSPLIFGFFLFGPAHDLLGGIRPRIRNVQDTLLIALPIISVVLVIALCFVPRGFFKKITPNLNLLAAVFLLYNLGTLVYNVIDLNTHIQSHLSQNTALVTAAKIKDDSDHPDVYYVILDAYPSNESLMHESKIDNSKFTDALEDRGFFVAYDSTSNYPRTLASMPSSLNMRYLVPHEGPEHDAGVAYARALIADGAVSQQFLSYGYTYVFVMSGFDTPSTTADLNLDYYPDGFHTFPRGTTPPANSFQISFWPLLLDSTVLSQSGLDLSFLRLPIERPVEWERISRAQATFEETPRIAEMPEATFTVIHLMLPHQPVRVTRDGREITDPAELDAANDGSGRKAAFIDQLGYLNDRVLGMVDQIEAKSATPPIIIIQGDHGSILGNHHPGGNYPFFRNLNAYLFPGEGKQAGLATNITPVNSFRVLFNNYFGTDYEILDTHHYKAPSGSEDLFNFAETDNLR